MFRAVDLGLATVMVGMVGEPNVLERLVCQKLCTQKPRCTQPDEDDKSTWFALLHGSVTQSGTAT